MKFQLIGVFPAEEIEVGVDFLDNGFHYLLASKQQPVLFFVLAELGDHFGFYLHEESA